MIDVPDVLDEKGEILVLIQELLIYTRRNPLDTEPRVAAMGQAFMFLMLEELNWDMNSLKDFLEVSPVLLADMAISVYMAKLEGYLK